MMQRPFDKSSTALLVIDPYNDFISEGGKVWPRLKPVAEATGCVPNMLQALNAARGAGLRVFYSLHRRYRPGDYEAWQHIAPVQKAARDSKVFEHGTWGGEIRTEFAPRPGEIVAQLETELQVVLHAKIRPVDFGGILMRVAVPEGAAVSPTISRAAGAPRRNWPYRAAPC